MKYKILLTILLTISLNYTYSQNRIKKSDITKKSLVKGGCQEVFDIEIPKDSPKSSDFKNGKNYLIAKNKWISENRETYKKIVTKKD